MGVGAFLADLLDRGEYDQCLRAGEQLLMSSGNTLEDLVEINLAISRARLNLRDASQALAPALLARKIAYDMKSFVLLGKVYHALVASFYYTNQIDKSLATAYEYFEVIPPAYRLPADEGSIWYAIAVNYGLREFEYEKSIDAANRALRCFELAQDLDNALRTGQIIALNYISLMRYDLARKWLHRCGQQARALPKNHWMHQYILLRRAQLALAEGRRERAMVLAHRTMARDYGFGSQDVRFNAMMLLHTIFFELKEYKDALGYALAARVFALDCRLFWLEYEAAEAMVKTIKVAGNTVVEALDKEYLSSGVDMTRYMPDSVLKTRD